MTPAECRKEFGKLIGSISPHRNRYERFSDFLELATCAVRKTTLPPGPDADQLEKRYMDVVARYPADDIRNVMPKLLGLTQLALIAGGNDFLGDVAQELELLDTHLGQFLTPYHVSQLLAELTVDDAPALLAERGFLTASDPCSGAGGMVIAIADAIERKGLDPRSVLYVEAVDIANLCFQMTYLQLAARGVPARVVRANSLTREFFEAAFTPAFFPFLLQHGEAFRQWQQEQPAAALPTPGPHLPLPPPRPASTRAHHSPNPAQGDLFAQPPPPDPQAAPTSPSARAKKKAEPAP